MLGCGAFSVGINKSSSRRTTASVPEIQRDLDRSSARASFSRPLLRPESPVRVNGSGQKAGDPAGHPKAAMSRKLVGGGLLLVKFLPPEDKDITWNSLARAGSLGGVMGCG